MIKFIIFIAVLLPIKKLFPHELDLVKPIMPTNCIILDCGANAGKTSKDLANKFRGSTVLAVEADPQIFTRLNRNTASNKRIKPFNFALGKENGVASFYPNSKATSHNAQGSLFPQSKSNWYWSAELDSTPIKVPAKTLDTFCEENDIAEIHFMFLDMQGGEYQMLSNSESILNTTRAIFTEVLFEQIYENCPLYPKLKDLLNQKGFKEVKLIKRHKSWGDALFIREEYIR